MKHKFWMVEYTKEGKTVYVATQYSSLQTAEKKFEQLCKQPGVSGCKVVEFSK